VDPNLENGLLWWAALAREQGGEEAYLEALDTIAEVQGSWRPQLWLARHRLDEGNLDAALELYRHVLEMAADQSDALLMISGDLGNAGHIDQVFELVYPRYVPERHALSVGFNLLNATVQANRRQEGEALLHRIGLLNAPHAREQVAAFGRSLDELKAAELGPPEATEPDAAPTIVDVPRPLWHTYLGRPDWLLPSVPRQASVGILTLADATGNERIGGGPEPATTVGGLARAVPLVLAEALLYTTDVEPMAIIPVVRGLGPVVPAEGWPPEDVIDLGRTEGAELNYIVTGSIAQSEAATSVRLELWDIERGEAIDSLAKETTAEDAGTALVDLGLQLVGRLVNEGKAQAITDQTQTHYTVPTGALLDGYLAASDELFALTLAGEGLTDPVRLYGERDILNHLLSLGLANRQVLLPKLVLLAGLVLNRARGSMIYQEYRASAVAMADAEKDPASDSFAVTGAAYHLFDRADALEARVRQLAENGRQPVADWLNGFR